MICECKQFDKNVKKINDIIIFASTHRIKYDGDIFKYCPWCGKELYYKKEK